MWSTSHMVWLHLASPLLLSALHPHRLAINSSKHCISPNLRAFAWFLFVQYLPPLPIYLFLLTLIYPSVSSQISPPRRGFLSTPQTRVIYPSLYTSLHFFHKTYNECGIAYISQLDWIRSSFSSLDHQYTLGV